MRQTNMNPSLKQSGQLLRHRKIGKKVLFADRLSHAMRPRKSRLESFKDRLPTLSRKQVIVMGVAVVVISSAALGAVRAYTSYAEAKQREVVKQQEVLLKAKSAAADACRREKAQQKAELIGKVTYDELYDYGACDK